MDEIYGPYMDQHTKILQDSIVEKAMKACSNFISEQQRMQNIYGGFPDFDSKGRWEPLHVRLVRFKKIPGVNELAQLYRLYESSKLQYKDDGTHVRELESLRDDFAYLRQDILEHGGASAAADMRCFDNERMYEMMRFSPTSTLNFLYRRNEKESDVLGSFGIDEPREDGVRCLLEFGLAATKHAEDVDDTVMMTFFHLLKLTHGRYRVKYPLEEDPGKRAKFVSQFVKLLEDSAMNKVKIGAAMNELYGVVELCSDNPVDVRLVARRFELLRDLFTVPEDGVLDLVLGFCMRMASHVQNNLFTEIERKRFENERFTHYMTAVCPFDTPKRRAGVAELLYCMLEYADHPRYDMFNLLLEDLSRWMSNSSATERSLERVCYVRLLENMQYDEAKMAVHVGKALWCMVDSYKLKLDDVFQHTAEVGRKIVGYLVVQTLFMRGDYPSILFMDLAYLKGIARQVEFLITAGTVMDTAAEVLRAKVVKTAASEKVMGSLGRFFVGFRGKALTQEMVDKLIVDSVWGDKLRTMMLAGVSSKNLLNARRYVAKKFRLLLLYALWEGHVPEYEEWGELKPLHRTFRKRFKTVASVLIRIADVCWDDHSFMLTGWILGEAKKRAQVP